MGLGSWMGRMSWADIAAIAVLSCISILWGGGKGESRQAPRASLRDDSSQPKVTNSNWLAFGGYIDWFYPEEGDWSFRFGTNFCENLAVFSCGEIRRQVNDSSNRISAISLPASIAPKAKWHLISVGNVYREFVCDEIENQESQIENPPHSIFWHCITPSNTLLLNWSGALLNRAADSPIGIQAELFQTGAVELHYDFSSLADLTALSNATASVWRDGVPETVSLQTGRITSVSFQAPSFPVADSLADVRSRITDMESCYEVAVAVAKGPALVTVSGDGESDLGNYSFIAHPGVTNKVPMLVGMLYVVSSESAFTCLAPIDDGRWTAESHPAASNVSDRVAEVEWPVTLSLMETLETSDETFFTVMPTPGFLKGEVSLDGASETASHSVLRSASGCGYCGCVSLVATNALSNSVACGCSSCSVDGWYLYCGYAIGFTFNLIGNGGGGGPLPEDNNEDGNGDDAEASVSVAFDKNVVLFEDGYEDLPGVFVGHRSTEMKVEVTANGGSHGGSLSVDFTGGIGLADGQSGFPGTVAAKSTIKWTAMCVGLNESSSDDGAVVKVSFVENETGKKIDASAHATSIRLELRPYVEKAGRRNRHTYGVGEIVECLHYPESANVEWTCANSGAGIVLEDDGSKILCCPILGNDNIGLVAMSGEVVYGASIRVVEPDGLLCTSVSPISFSSNGVAGLVGMNLRLYVTPLAVSFANIAVQEVPCDTGSRFGYFADPKFADRWSHTVQWGAGVWRNIKEDNYFADDSSYSGIWQPPWSSGSMTWNIPVGWTVSSPDSSVSPDKEFPVQYESSFAIDCEGTFTKGKHGHVISRTTNNVVRLDGVLVD